MNDIEIGSHVICVDDKALPEIKSLFRHWPVKGEHYVVRDVLLGVHHPKIEGSIRLLLVGLKNDSPRNPMNELGYDVRRFRKLEQVKVAVKAVEQSKKFNKIPA